MNDTPRRYFKECRRDPAIHMEMGDIRLTKGMQDHLCAMYDRLAAENQRMRAMIKDMGYDPDEDEPCDGPDEGDRHSIY
jgi:hypothetical protein